MATNILPQSPAQGQAPHRGQNQQNITDILITFDDLQQHGDLDAAALALGDAWLMLPPTDRAAAANLIKSLAKGGVTQ